MKKYPYPDKFSEVLIDLGRNWNVTLPLSELFSIDEIMVDETENGWVVSFRVGERVYRTKTIKTPETVKKVKQRLISYSDGIVPPEDVEKVKKRLTEMEIIKDYEMNPVVGAMRAAVYNHEKKPYFNLQIQYNPDMERFVIRTDFSVHMGELVEKLLTKEEQEVAVNPLAAVALLSYEPLIEWIEKASGVVLEEYEDAED